VKPSPARAEPHDAEAWLPVPVPDHLPEVEELLTTDDATAAPAARDGAVGVPSPARAEPHDETTWLPLPEVEGLPSIHELLAPDPDAPAPIARDVPVAQPSPARAEPHDETSWLPLPEFDDLPEITELVESDSGGGRPPGRIRRRLHVGWSFRQGLRAALTITVVGALVGSALYLRANIFDNGSQVDLTVDGRHISATTGVSSVASFLRERHVVLGAHDRVVPGATAAVTDGMTVHVFRAFPVSADFDGHPMTFFSTWRDPHDFLVGLHLAPRVVFRTTPKAITKSSVLVLRTKKRGSLLVDGTGVNYDSPSANVSELLQQYDVILGPQDYTQPIPVSAALPDNASVVVVRVASDTQQSDEVYTVPDETLPDPTLEVGGTRVVDAKPGLQRVTYEVTRQDGNIVGRTPISKVPLKEAKPKITYFGTKADPRWDKIAACETGSNWAAPGPTYQGGLGIYYKNWQAFGGTAFAPTAGEATREQQIIVAMRIQKKYGFGAWGCGRKLGYG
jgi:uncharacterized protein YabE (DUF348 family)